MAPTYSIDSTAESVACRGLMADTVLSSLTIGPNGTRIGAARSAEGVFSVSSSFVGDVWGRTGVGDWLITAVAATSQRPVRALIQSLLAAALGPRDRSRVPERLSQEVTNPLPAVLTSRTAREEDVFLAIAVAFHGFPQVKSVYVQKFRADIQIFTVLTIRTYDGELMEKLLDQEWEIRQAFPELFFDFVYPIGNSQGAPDFIHPRTRCIYSR